MLKALVALIGITAFSIVAIMMKKEYQAMKAQEAESVAITQCAADLASLKPYRYETPESYALQKRVGACVASGLISQSELDARLAELR